MQTPRAYERVYRDMRDRILQGFYAVGQRIPPERQLCSEFNVSRITMRHSLRFLQEQGLLERKQGRGTFVSGFKSRKFPIIDNDYTRSVQSGIPDLQRRLLRKTVLTPPCPIAEQLQISREKPCFFAERLDYTPDGPVAFDRLYIPLLFAKNLDDRILERVDFLEVWLETEKLSLSHFIQIIEAVSSVQESANLLNAERGQPLILTTDILYAQGGEVLAVFESYYPGDKVKLISTTAKGERLVATAH